LPDSRDGAAAFRDHEFGRRMRCRLNGLKRAAYWRALGFPNFKLGIAARMQKRRLAKLPDVLEHRSHQ
jgi:hypothetical protein